MAARRSKAKSGSVRVNFKDVETRTRVNKEGDYPLTLLEAKDGKSGGGNEQIEFIFEVKGGEYKGAKAWFYCPLAENSLWKLHALLTAMGVEVPDDEMDIDLSELAGNEIVGVFTPDTYNGKRSFKMTDFYPMSDYSGGDADEDDGKKSKKDKKKSKEEPADEGKAGKKDKGKKSDKDDDAKSDKKDKGKKSDKDDDAKSDKKDKKKDKGSKAKKYSKDDIEDMDEDELAALVKEAKLSVKLKGKLKKDISAVLGELEEKDLLDD